MSFDNGTVSVSTWAIT